MVVRSQKGPIWVDTSRRFEEVHGFLAGEVEYARIICKKLGGDGDEEQHRFRRAGGAAAESARAYLTLARRMEHARRSADSLVESQELKEEIQECFGTVPGLLSAFTSSYLQRRQKGVHQFFSRSTHSQYFSLSEINLGYAVTIRGIEVLAEWLHRSLSAFWGGVGCQPPLISIAGERHPALLGPAGEQPELSKDLGAHLTHVLNAYHMLLPRWLPAQLRFGTVLGHETFHRVLHLATMRMEVLGRHAEVACECPRQSVLDEWREEFKRVFSDELVALDDIGTPLRQSIYDLFELCQVPRADHDRESDQNLRAAMAKGNADEILCDVAGLVTCGPAYLCASSAVLLGDPRREESRFADAAREQPSHPPSYARVMVQAKVLGEYLGFEEVASQFLEDFGIADTWKSVARWHPFTAAYYSEVVESQAFQDACRTLVGLICDSMRNEEGCQPHIAGWDGHPSEREWATRWDSIFELIKGRGVLGSDLAEFAPPDILNAIWWKTLQPKHADLGEFRMEWGMALRNVGRH